jgi:murein endopeptidase
VGSALKLLLVALLLAAPARADQLPAPRRHLDKLEDGPGFTVVNPARAFGTPLAVRRLRETFERYHARYPEAASIMVMDLSKRGGGRLHPHASHHAGRDVDVRYALNCRTKYFVDASPFTLDAERTWFLISTLIATGDVELIFVNRKLQRYLYRHAAAQGVPEEQLDELFQYRHGVRQKVGIIRHEPGHVGHFHVRFRRAAPHEQVPLARAKGGCHLAAAWARLECRGLGSPL